MRPVLLHPRSRGTVTLRSADPTAPVRIANNFLSAPRISRRCAAASRWRASLRWSRRWTGSAATSLAPGPEVRTEAEIDAWIRATVITVNHPLGTCAMGNGPDAVLDPELRVRGVERTAGGRCIGAAGHAVGTYQCDRHDAGGTGVGFDPRAAGVGGSECVREAGDECVNGGENV